MLTKDFYGRQGYIWFYGVVEDVDDPSQLGQVRVRIIGLHSNDKNLMPTEKLPWAQVVGSPTAAKTHSGLIVGDWVKGHFQDGEFAQIPVIDGVFPGVQGTQSSAVYDYIQSTKGNDYFPVSSQHFREVGEGTTFRSVRGVLENTLTELNNSRLSHTCGIKPEIDAAIAWARMEASLLIQELVTQLKALAQALGLDPTGLVAFVVSILKYINTFVKWINSIMEDIKYWTSEIARIVELCRRIVDYILSLPERLMAMILDCLKYFMGGIQSFLSGVLGEIGSVVFGSLTQNQELISEINQLNSSINQLGSNTTAIIGNVTGTALNVKGMTNDVAMTNEFITNIVSPNSPETQSSAINSIPLYLTVLSTNSETIVYNDVYFNNKYATP